MRKPDRCIPMMLEMGALWKTRVPDWRFGQLLSNFASSLGTDIFYIEDDEFMKKFEDYINKYE